MGLVIEWLRIRLLLDMALDLETSLGIIVLVDVGVRLGVGRVIDVRFVDGHGVNIVGVVEGVRFN